eukprot:snap_masked-scaffold_14-processed-gene-0.12-mRNA-1 protein AED:1.00 eAED:1.00 QI:0/0/0/0/1/1/2/0/194
MSFCNGADCCNLCCNDLASSGRVVFDNCFLGCEDDSCGEDEDCLVGVNFVDPDNQPFDFNGASICCTSLGERLAGEDCSSILAPTDGDDGEETRAPTSTGGGGNGGISVPEGEDNDLIFVLGMVIGVLMLGIIFLLFVKRIKKEIPEAQVVEKIVHVQQPNLIVALEEEGNRNSVKSIDSLMKDENKFDDLNLI